MTNKEIDIIFKAIDADDSGTIDVKEFSRKLEHYGVKTRSREEVIIYQMIEAVNRSKINKLSELFEIMDKHGTGYITREDFADVFKRLPIKINEKELDRFMDNFWRDKNAGIDYQGFLRIFSRYQVRLAKEGQAKKVRQAVSEDSIRTKLRIF